MEDWFRNKKPLVFTTKTLHALFCAGNKMLVVKSTQKVAESKSVAHKT